MSEEGDFLREFEDEESCDPHGQNGFVRQQSKMSDMAHKNSGFFSKQDSGIGGIGTPQSSHIDLNRVESHMSATTNEIAR